MNDILGKLFENIKNCLFSLKTKLDLPEISASLAESIIRLGDGSLRKGDINLIFASPFLKPYCSRLPIIGEIMLDESKHWQIPLKNFTVATSSRHPNQPSILVFNLDRKITITNILSYQNCENIQTKSKILLDWSSHQTDEWVQLRFSCIIDFIINLNQLSNFKIVLKRKSDAKNVNAIENLRLDAFEDGNFSKTFRINSSFEAELISALKNCIFKLSNDAESLQQYFIMDQMLQELHNYEELIILINLRELFEFQKLLMDWIKLRNLQEHLKKVNFICVGDIHCDISHSEYCSSLSEFISEQREFNYPPENLEALINCCVRYSILSVATHIGNHIDRNKYKQALFAQYNYARLENILKKFSKINRDDRPPDLTIIESSKEWNLVMKYILFFPKLVNEILINKKVHKLAIFLNSLSNDISLYYHKTRILTQFNSRTIPIIKARINFAYKVQELIKTCLYLMGCQVVDFM